MAFSIDVSETTELLGRFHDTLMRRRQTPNFDDFDPSIYPDEVVEFARNQWAGRANAEYQSTAQFAQLLHRLTLVGAPLELIGAATRLAQDECRHAELCACMADALGGRHGHDVGSGLSLLDDEPDPWLAIGRTVLNVCCFAETLSIPMLESITLVSTDPFAQATARIISADEEYHSRYGWQVLEWLLPRFSTEQRAEIERRLPGVMAHFERASGASPELLSELAGADIEIQAPGPDAPPNLGTLTRPEYAAIFYHTLENEIWPGLEALGFDPVRAWSERPLSG